MGVCKCLRVAGVCANKKRLRMTAALLQSGHHAQTKTEKLGIISGIAKKELLTRGING